MASGDAAERARLIAEIHSLEQRIYTAEREQEHLENELEYLIETIPILTNAAQSMSDEVTSDVGVLAKHIEGRSIDARDLLQLLRDVSEKYFTYKNLSTATKNLTQFTDEYYTKFQFFHELRRISLGCVMAVDGNLISQETTRTKVEKAYLANTDYWLAYAASAVMLWWADEPEAADRAVRRALLISERKSALFFLFCNLKFGRRDTAMRWYAYYLGCIRANDVGEEFQYLLEAHLTGALGGDHSLAIRVAAKVSDMLDEIAVYDINFDSKVSEDARRFMATKAHTTDFEFFYLPEYCKEGFPSMKQLLSDAEKNEIVARDYQKLYQEEPNDDGVKERLEDSIYNLIESMDPEEEKLYRRIRYNELIVAAKGDIHTADQAFEERYPERKPVGFADLLRTWAFTEDDVNILPQTRRFAIEKLVPSIQNGARKFADDYRTREQERYTIAVDGWTMSCNENELPLAKSSFLEFYRKHNLTNYLKDKFVLIWLGMIAIGIVGLVVAGLWVRQPALIVISMLLVLVGAFCLWRQLDSVRMNLLRRKKKDLEIITRTLEEMGRWRKEYRAADKGTEALQQAIGLFAN